MSSRSLFVLASILWSCAAVQAQIPPQGHLNGKHFANPINASASPFPNYTSPGGNIAGDSIWKILTRAGMKNGAGSETITGVVLPVANGNFTGGATDIPDLEIRAVVQEPGAPAGCLIPNIHAPAIATVVAGPIAFPSPNFWLVDLGYLGQDIPVANGPLAIGMIATPGESVISPDAAVPFVSLGGTDPDPLACGHGKSGLFDARLGIYVPDVLSHELYLETAFLEPTLEPVVNMAGPANSGYGAYDISLSAPGPPVKTLGWHVEASQHIGNIALPLASFTGANLAFPIGNVSVLLDPDPFLDFLLTMQQAGTIIPYSGGIELDGFFDTFRFPLPTTGLAGQELHVAFVIFDIASGQIVDATNTCTTRFHL